MSMCGLHLDKSDSSEKKLSGLFAEISPAKVRIYINLYLMIKIEKKKNIF